MDPREKQYYNVFPKDKVTVRKVRLTPRDLTHMAEADAEVVRQLELHEVAEPQKTIGLKVKDALNEETFPREFARMVLSNAATVDPKLVERVRASEEIRQAKERDRVGDQVRRSALNVLGVDTDLNGWHPYSWERERYHRMDPEIYQMVYDTLFTLRLLNDSVGLRLHLEDSAELFSDDAARLPQDPEERRQLRDKLEAEIANKKIPTNRELKKSNFV